MENKVAAISLDVEGLDGLKKAVDELTEHLRAAQSILDGIGTVELELRAADSDGKR